jgi:DNA-binding IclR family transcriptional regulator
MLYSAATFSQAQTAVKSIRKSVEALRLLAAPPHETSVAEVGRALGVTPSTASRMLAALREGGLVDQDPVTRRYRPGILALQLASGFRRGLDLMAAVDGAMDELVTATRHSAWIGVLADTEVVVVKTRQGSYPVQFGVEIGRRLPAHAAAMGKALLALRPDAELRRMFAGRLKAQTAHTLRSVDALLRDLAVVRRRGYARTDQELFQGIGGIAVAFTDPAGGNAMALSLSYPLFALDREDDRALVERLLALAGGIGARIGDPRWLDRGK